MTRSLFAVLCAAVLVSCGADPKGRGESESANPHACIGNLYTKGLEHVSGMVSGDGTVQGTAMTPQIIPDCVAGFVSAAFPDGRNTAGDAACIRLAGRVTSCADGYPVGATVSVAGTAVSAVSAVADRDGRFSLDIPGNSLVMVTRAGYNQKIFAVQSDESGSGRELNVSLEPGIAVSDNGTIVPSPMTWQPASDVGIASSRGKHYYDALGDILRDNSLSRDMFVNKVVRLEKEIASDTRIDERTMNALLCGTATALSGLDYWRANMARWSMLTHTPSGDGRNYCIAGTVIDRCTGESVIGAIVGVAGTTFGTVSDNNGHYELYIPAGYPEIRCSFPGYATEAVGIASSSNMNIFMERTVALDRDMLKVVAAGVAGAVGGYVSGGEYGAAVGSITAAANAGLSL